MIRSGSKRQCGFTMVELILVMTIMTLLGLFAAMAIHNAQDNAKIRETQATIKLIEEALDQYRMDMGHYPRGDGSTLPGLLTTPSSGWKGAGMQWFPNRADLKDAWGMVIQYCGCADYSSRGVERTAKKGDYYNALKHQIYSYGPNMKTWPSTTAAGGHPRLCGTEPDDIRNWKHEKFYAPTAYQ